MNRQKNRRLGRDQKGPRRGHRVKVYDDTGPTPAQVRDGILQESNGNLSWVEDPATGKGEWLAPHEYRDD